MKVAVLGATGATGARVVDKALSAGLQVVAVSRSPMPPRPDAPGFSRRNGDLADPVFLRDAISDCGAVISCLGQNRASKSLFAKRTSPPDILQRVAGATLEAMGGGAQHLVYLSAFGVGEDRRRHALLFRIVLRLSSVHEAYLDHAEAEAAIRASGARWTIVRPPGLTDADQEVALVDKGDRWSSFETASRRSVAAFLVGCVQQGGPLQRTLTIGEPTSGKA